MNPDPSPIAELRDALLRRELTPTEEDQIAAWLKARPSESAEWRADLALARAVRRLPDQPLPSNFTSQVLRQIRQDQLQHAPTPPFWHRWLSRPWIPVAGATCVVAAICLTGWEIHTAKRAADYAHQVNALRALSGLSPAVLEDFEAVRRLGESTSPVDFALLAALQ